MSKTINIQIPTDFTIEHYNRLGEFEHLPELLKIIRVISAISGFSEEEIKTWSLSSINEIYQDLHKRIVETVPIFLPVFQFEGIDYGIQSISKMSAGEYIDLETQLQKGDMLGTISILYRPIVSHKFDSLEWKLRNGIKYIQGKAENLFKYYTIEEYDVEKREWRKEIFKNLPVNIALGAYNFFLLIGIQLSNDFLQSSPKLTEEEKLKWKNQMESLFPNIGVGFSHYTTLVKKEESYGLREKKMLQK